MKDIKQRLHDDYGVDVAPSTISNWECEANFVDIYERISFLYDE